MARLSGLVICLLLGAILSTGGSVFKRIIFGRMRTIQRLKTSVLSSNYFFAMRAYCALGVQA